VGTISGAATAALVELDPDGDRRRAALFAGLAQAGGSASGPLLAGALAEWAAAPLRLCYFVGLVATVGGAVLILRIPEPVGRDREPWRIQLPRVPRDIRAPFVRVSLTAATAWAAMGLFLSIVPSYAADLLHTHNLALLALIAALALITSSVAQLVVTYRHGTPARDEAAGLALLGAGLATLIIAAPLGSLPLMIVAGVGAGFGHGLAFLNAQQELNEVAPQERRGEITAAFIAGIYALLATSVVGSGLLDEYVSLTVAVAVVAAGLATTAGATAVWHTRVARR
jgi:MFS family permease